MSAKSWFDSSRDKLLFVLLQVTVENSGDRAPVLLDAALKNSQKTHVMKILTNLKNPVSIAPSSCFKIEVEATGRYRVFLYNRF